MTRAELEETMSIVSGDRDCLMYALTAANEELFVWEVKAVIESLDSLAKTLEYSIQDRVCRGELCE